MNYLMISFYKFGAVQSITSRAGSFQQLIK